MPAAGVAIVPNKSDSAKSDSGKPWAPLTIPGYRVFWIAGLFSNLGTWMHETGAQWLMTSMEPSPEMVSAVRTCMTIPVFLLALPAGVWADRFDRKRWLLFTQLLLLLIAALMAVLTLSDWMTPALLLLLTAGMGVGMILNQPAWQALTPELVPPALIPSAVSVGSISFNLARSLGPAIAGLLIAQFGVWATFGFNAISFLAVVGVLIRWQPEVDPKKKRKKPRFFDELRKGLFVVRNSPEIRNALLRVLVFAISASILWSLLALVATEKLGFQERGFGFCLGLIGGGAVVGAWFIPTIRQRFSSEAIVLAAQWGYGLICVLIGLSGSRWFIMPALFGMGICWMAIMTTLNATAQVYLPRKFRARGMSAFLMAFALGMGIGSALWGWFAFWAGISAAFVAAGVVKVIASSCVHSYKIGSLRTDEATPS